jgi:hypothetical protein
MREHRWETRSALSFDNILSVASKLRQDGLTSIHEEKEMIGYIEEWEVSHPQQIQALASWPTEDVTLLHLLDNWQGDFFLLAGRYHSTFQTHQTVNTYCSIAHPWHIAQPLATLLPEAWFWMGFRHTHGFIRVRVHTTDIIAPGESVEHPHDMFWLNDREEAFRAAIQVLDLPIEVTQKSDRVLLHTTRTDAPLFCSWPDAFGPCQFELNSPDPFEFLVPASQLAATHQGKPANLRVYFTGFPESVLLDFTRIAPNPRLLYRCSIHCTLSEMPDLLRLLEPRGRVYGSLAEFQTGHLFPESADAAVIVGLVGTNGEFRLEIRLNQRPLPHQDTEQWLEELVGHALIYSPLPAFP